MHVTILGSSGSYPGANQACSGYLVQEGGTRLLVDCGTGVLANLQSHLALSDLTAVIISHMHADHFFDLVPMRYALAYGGHPRSTPLPLYLPPRGRQVWEAVVAPLAEPNNAFSAPFEIAEYRQGASYRLRDLTVQLTPIKHYITNYGMEIRGTGRLVYSGDAGPSQNLVSLARQADVFLCEATWLESDIPPRQRGHLTAREAGEIARDAGVHHLLLTHLTPDTDADKSLQAAQAAFRGKVSLARQGESYRVNPNHD